MMEAFFAPRAFEKAAQKTSKPRVAIFDAGLGDYLFSRSWIWAGNLKSWVAPQKLHRLLLQHNERLIWSSFCIPKTFLLIAINGLQLRASCSSSASLLRRYYCSWHGYLFNAFCAWGVCPEGCSSVHFARLYGEKQCQRNAGSELEAKCSKKL